jgi:hypothetical protein
MPLLAGTMVVMPTLSIPRRIVDLNRAFAKQSFDNTTTVFKAVGDGVKRVLDVSRVAGKTVVGQTRAAAEHTAASATTGMHEITGQARAQGERVGKATSQATKQVLDTADRVVSTEPSSGTPYEQWTRVDLYHRAQELDVDGRATMNKQQLIAALRHN